MIITLQLALSKARKYCAYQERSQQEVRDKLYSLGLHKQDVEQGIAVLITENFINEERFAMTFAGGKFRAKKWGRIKIKMALQSKKVSTYCINKSLAQFSSIEYNKVIQKLINDQEKKSKEKNPAKKKYQIAQYLISRGFEPDLIWNTLALENNQ